MDFPRTLYTSPGSKKWGKKTFDDVIVKNEEEYSAAVKAGFIDSFDSALFPKEESEEVETETETEVEETEAIEESEEVEKPNYKQLAIDAGVEGDELKKFMKKNNKNKQSYLDNLKG